MMKFFESQFVFIAGLLTPALSLAAAPTQLSISASVTPIVLMQGQNASHSFGEIDLTAVNGSTMESNNLCIYNNASTAYTVTATSANASNGVFQLNDGSSNYIRYIMVWYDNPLTGNGTSRTLISGTASEPLLNANTTDITCSGGKNASFKIHIPQSDAQRAPPAGYTDTLTIIINSI